MPLTRYVKLRIAHAPGMPGTFPRHRLQKKALVSDLGMHHGTCVTHVPWCMSGSLTRGGGENVPGIPGACATRNFTYLVRGPWYTEYQLMAQPVYLLVAITNSCLNIQYVSVVQLVSRVTIINILSLLDWYLPVMQLIPRVAQIIFSWSKINQYLHVVQ